MRELESARSGSLFATPVLSHVWPDGSELNSQLRQSILEHACRSPGKTRTNVGGWHSRADLLDWPSPEVGTLKGWILESVKHMVAAAVEKTPPRGMLGMKAWANVSRA